MSHPLLPTSYACCIESITYVESVLPIPVTSLNYSGVRRTVGAFSTQLLSSSDPNIWFERTPGATLHMNCI